MGFCYRNRHDTNIRFMDRLYYYGFFVLMGDAHSEFEIAQSENYNLFPTSVGSLKVCAFCILVSTL